jgi:hypothetical protein
MANRGSLPNKNYSNGSSSPEIWPKNHKVKVAEQILPTKCVGAVKV